MNTQTHKCEGVILTALNYKDYDQILTLFTQEAGLMKIFVKRAWSKKEGKGSNTAPLTHAEFIYTIHKSELYTCRELSVLNLNLQLRKNLNSLEAACDMGKALLASQMLHKPSPDLYKLLLYYMEKIPLAPFPEILAASFRLKILRHDGLFGLNSQCSLCHEELASQHISEGESFCERHAPRGSTTLTSEEARIVSILAYSRSLEELAALQLSSVLCRKIDSFFDKQMLPH